jgi:hypothetical protein
MRRGATVYKIKRNHIIEELEIEDNGKVLALSVDLNADTVLQSYNRAQYKIAQASIDAKKASGKDLDRAQQAMGEAILGLFEVVFGEKQTMQIVDFYGNRPLEMLGDIAPFISDVVAPKIQAAQQQVEEKYKQVTNRAK